MTTNIDNLKQRAEFAKKYISDMLKDTGLCIYGISKETNELYLVDRRDMYENTARMAVSINIEDINNLF